AAAVPGFVAGASPSSEPSSISTAPPRERPPFEAWLDRPLPSDAEPGGRLEVGATMWDRLGGEIPRVGATIFLRIVPPNGAAPPLQSFARMDWPGHYRGTVEVPAGGLGRLELGVTGMICENDQCRPDDWIFEIGGVGPPPGAPISALADARISIGDTIVAATPSDVTVTLTPAADWESFVAPDTIVVRAREPRGRNVATGTLPLRDASAILYEGTITIPRAGDLVLEAATDEDGGDATRFGTSMIPITAASGAANAPTDLGRPDGRADDGPPAAVVVVLMLVAIAGAGVIVSGMRRSEG
ncbi:MAG TPA: hypothetical protein VFV72_05780, partial [Candidatus Limnocylindrales bacterium]|nr:hypothetical protein [Candidatus Limnocylindrales bacterium]